MQKLNELKKRCLEDKIPILRDQTTKHLLDLINQNNYKSYLEIGTAYGYSCLNVCHFCHTIKHIITVEKDEKRYLVAKKYLGDFSYVDLVLEDCFVFLKNNNDKFDFILVDGPKSHQIQIIEDCLNKLNDNGIIFVDNIHLNDIRNKEFKTKNQISILKKIDELKQYLISKKDIVVNIFDIDDGFAIIKKFCVKNK